MVVYESGISDSNRHIHERLRRRQGQRHQDGRHIDYGKDTPVANLHLTRDRMKRAAGSLGDSTGLLEI